MGKCEYGIGLLDLHRTVFRDILGSEFPKTWKPIAPGKPYGTTLLTSSDDEFKMVAKKVMDTKGSAAVKSIVKVRTHR